ncbi:hypothetical protein [Reyranella soli]|jgi:hypothetical protein|uniref:hypothetical protein n=1 Tax=Reyranella soli TaxID=1230389 RepID=UPI0011BDED53|nr:hypothetical protein [Reyranella soli]
MKPVLFLLSVAIVAAHQASAQPGREARDSGADARTDSMLGTPNKVTPVPQTNRFSTSPGLEQQAPGAHGKPPPPSPPPRPGEQR